jgi:undecaprenyl-diphosphatase
MSRKLSRKKAAEFSFFLAVPTMLAATGYKMLKNWDAVFTRADGSMNTDNLVLLGIGNLVAFVVAMLAIKGFITFLTRYGFKLFGYYRIVLGALILILFALGYDLKIG